jgi:iron complex outermembrane recepter protein
VRISVLSAAICMSLVGMSAASQVEAAIRRSTHIPAQGLGPALQTLARDHDFQVLYRTEIVGDLRTTGAVGELSTTEALTQLLGGTGLTYLYLDDRTVTIVPVSAGATGVKAIGGGAQMTVPQSERPARSGRERAATGEERRSFWSRIRLAQADQQESSTSAARQSGGAAEEQALRIEEIIVTAQKRTERLQDVPISLSVLSGDDLDGSTVEGISEALNRVPGIATTLGFQGGGTLLSTRGVTASGSLFYGAGPMAYYLDSVPFGLVKSAIAPDANGFDLDRVEVLRGPQGTLYGASALNGVVRILTKDADLEAFEIKTRAATSVTEGGGENYRADAALNVPLIEGKLAARAVVGYQDLSGWIDRPGNEDDANGGKLRNLRLKINAQPTDQLAIGLSGWLSRTDYDGQALADDDNRHRGFIDEPITTDYDAFGLKVAYDFAPFSLVSATSYLDYFNDSNLDFFPSGLPASSLQTSFDASVFAQELIATSTHAGAWRWSLGGMYRDARDELYQLGAGPFVAYAAPTRLKYLSKSQAVFGELTRIFNDGKLELTAGLRYFEDEVTQEELSRLDALPPSRQFAERTFDATTPRVIVTWHPSQQTTTYASYSEGFRSGSDQEPTVLAVAALPPAEPDTLKNYEVGMKTTGLQGRLGFEAALYYIDWQDVQQPITVPINATVFLAAVINGEAATGPGFDLGLTARPIDGLNLGITFSWNDLAMDADVFSGSELLFAKGDRLNYSPEYTAGVSADYVFALGRSGLEGRLSASANYTSKQTVRQYSFGVVNIADGDTMSTARLGFAVGAADRWTATLFVDNATNERGSPVRFTGLVPFSDWDARVRPRTIGVQLEYRFGQ